MLCAAAFLAVGIVSAQDKGVKFTEDTFENVLKAAEKSGKYVFVDVYTTWCGPCKFLSSNIFPAETVGNYMNKTFVNAKFDAEKGEGVEIAKKYKVEGYPTMLILDSKGKELGKLVGSSRTPEDFVKRLQGEVAKIEK